MMPFFLQIAWDKHAELVLKKIFIDVSFITNTAITSVKCLLAFITTISLKIFSPPCAKPQVT